ncbi:MAG: energy-coupling factor ABC transporter permease [Planctomycetota bacterium]|nr:energy-coupling factor ABC transporter permease [Planctomycetota bacterium]
MRGSRKALLILLGVAVALFPSPAYAMHISESILPGPWAGLWFAVSLPFVLWGLRDIQQRSREKPYTKALVGLVGAAVFIVSCMPIPVPWLGTCSHPCGTGLAAILIGPWATVVVASIALLLQALFLAHGGLSTLGANICSMGVAGAFIGYGVFLVARRVGASFFVAAFLAGLLSDWGTYATTSFELASALCGDNSPWQMFLTILVAFAPTQIPLGVAEGAVGAMACLFIHSRRPELLGNLMEGKRA